jgi:hypothetical protein
MRGTLGSYDNYNMGENKNFNIMNIHVEDQ